MISAKISPDLEEYDENICLNSQKDWDDGVHMLLFPVREAFQDSLGFSPFEMFFSHSVGGT